jgi:hypothetical protein
METACKQHLESGDPSSITWEGFKKFLANHVATPGMCQVYAFACYNQASKVQDTTVATFVTQTDEFNAALLPLSDKRHMFCIWTAFDFPFMSCFPTDEQSPLRKVCLFCTATAIKI